MNYNKKGVIIPFIHGNKDKCKESMVEECENLDGSNEFKETGKLNDYLSINDKLFINMSHELKTPLNVIFSAAQMMEMSLTSDDGNNRNALKNIGHIKQNCYRLIKVVNNVMEMHNINSGNLKLNISKEDIVGVSRDIVQSSTEMVEDLGLKIFFNTNIDKKIILFDRVRIEKVLLNLISNAIKFSKPGSHINVNIFNKDDHVEVTVKDEGIGIEEKDLKNIFIGFEQVDKSFSRIAEGTGVGLFLVKSIIEMHGGSVSVNSVLGQGSEFVLKIPHNCCYEYKINNNFIMQESEDELVSIELSDIYKTEC